MKRIIYDRRTKLFSVDSDGDGEPDDEEPSWWERHLQNYDKLSWRHIGDENDPLKEPEKPAPPQPQPKPQVQPDLNSMSLRDRFLHTTSASTQDALNEIQWDQANKTGFFNGTPLSKEMMMDQGLNEHSPMYYQFTQANGHEPDDETEFVNWMRSTYNINNHDDYFNAMKRVSPEGQLNQADLAYYNKYTDTTGGSMPYRRAMNMAPHTDPNKFVQWMRANGYK